MWNKQNDTTHNAAFAKARETAEQDPVFVAELRQIINEQLEQENAALDAVIDALAVHS